jgi:hypothetical protein
MGEAKEKAACAALSEILVICRDHPSLCATAQHQLERLLSQLNRPAQLESNGGGRVHAAINQLSHRLKQDDVKCTRPTSVILREIVHCLAKKNDCPLDPKLKKADDLIAWLEEHWAKIETQFMLLLEGRLRNADEFNK